MQSSRIQYTREVTEKLPHEYLNRDNLIIRIGYPLLSWQMIGLLGRDDRLIRRIYAQLFDSNPIQKTQLFGLSIGDPMRRLVV